MQITFPSSNKEAKKKIKEYRVQWECKAKQAKDWLKKEAINAELAAHLAGKRVNI